MPLAWDSPLVSATARALTERLGGARLTAVFLDRGDDSVALHFREATLLAQLHPERGTLALHPAREPAVAARPLQARLRAVDAPPDDRVLRLVLFKVRGRRRRVDVVFELMTNQWNCAVLEGDEGTVRHVLRERSGARTVAPGLPYEPPPPSERAGVDGDLSLEAWMERLAPVEPRRRRGALLSGFAWTSAVNASALLGRAAETGGDDAADALGEGWALWRRVAAVARGEAPTEPVVLAGRDGGPQPYPLPLPADGEGAACEPASTLLGALAAVEDAHGAAGETALVPSALLEGLEREAARARKRADGLRRELAGTPEPGELRAVGDLLLARFGEVPRGADRVALVDFGGEEREVELDPRLSPDGNAEHYYDRAARAERARERLPSMVESAEEEARTLEALLERARAGEADPEELREAVPRSEEDGGGGRDSPALPYRRFRSSGGLEIRVGRGARKNDDLTFHHSRPDDVWLHARHASGAHVILRWDGDGNPPARDLGEAAVLAALHSKARTSGSVPVDWTRRKYVRKPRKAPPGAVVPDRVQTVFVTPDPKVQARLEGE